MTRLMKTGALFAACLVVCVVVAACTQGPKVAIDLTARDNGSKQTLAAGQQLRVTLDANPTTGYQWAVDGSLPSQLSQVGSAAYTSHSTAIGGGGSDLWTFVGASTGTGSVKLKYWRSFEPTATPIKTFELQVDVR